MLSTYWVVASVNTFFCRQAPNSRRRGALVGNGDRIAQGRTTYDVVPVDRHRYSY